MTVATDQARENLCGDPFGVRRCNAAFFCFSVSCDAANPETEKQKKAALHRRTPNPGRFRRVM
jgi:hypothetical protein